MDAGSTGPRRLGNYELGERLGSGGMGTVYTARHVETGVQYAVKLLKTSDPGLLLRFQREGEGQARVADHPNVVGVHSLDLVDGTPFLVMDLVEGGTLTDRLRAERPSPEQAARWVMDLAGAVECAHQRGVLHRDIKPANVLFDGERPLLVDFGLAKLADASSLTETGAILGTPCTMAPEQIERGRGELGPPTDVYGLGVLLYWCLTGQPPFGGESTLATLMTVVRQPPRRPRELAPDVPPALERVCLRCLEKDPGRRYSSAAALVAALDEALASRAETSRSRVVVALLAIAALLGVAAAVRGPFGGPGGSATPAPARPLPDSTAATVDPSGATAPPPGTLPPTLPDVSALPNAGLVHFLDIAQARALRKQGRDRAAAHRYLMMLSHPTHISAQMLRRLALLLGSTPDLELRNPRRSRRLLVRAALLGDAKAMRHVTTFLKEKVVGFEELAQESERQGLAAAAQTLGRFWESQRPAGALGAARAAYRKLWEAFPEAHAPLPAVKAPDAVHPMWSRRPDVSRAARDRPVTLRKSNPREAVALLKKLLGTAPSRGHAALYRELGTIPEVPREDQRALLARAALLGDGVAAALLARALDDRLNVGVGRQDLGLTRQPALAKACAVLFAHSRSEPFVRQTGPVKRPPTEAEARAAYRQVWLAFPDAR